MTRIPIHNQAPIHDQRIHGQGGSVTVVTLVVIAFAVVTCVATTRIGGALVSHRHASAVADVTALAAATGGPDAANTVAEANRADLIVVEQVGGAWLVSIVQDRIIAGAAARLESG